MAILSWMEQKPEFRIVKGSRYEHPRDPADLGRCLRLLNLEPECRKRLPEMSAASPEWAALIANWRELERLYYLEYPTGHAPKCYDKMQALIYPKK